MGIVVMAAIEQLICVVFKANDVSEKLEMAERARLRDTVKGNHLTLGIRQRGVKDGAEVGSLETGLVPTEKSKSRESWLEPKISLWCVK